MGCLPLGFYEEKEEKNEDMLRPTSRHYCCPSGGTTVASREALLMPLQR